MSHVYDTHMIADIVCLGGILGSFGPTSRSGQIAARRRKVERHGKRQLRLFTAVQYSLDAGVYRCLSVVLLARINGAQMALCGQ